MSCKNREVSKVSKMQNLVNNLFNNNQNGGDTYSIVYDVQSNLKPEHKELVKSDIVFIQDLAMFSKYTQALKNIISAFLIDFKEYYLRQSTKEDSEFLKIYMIGYNDKYVSEIQEYSYKDTLQMFEDLSNTKKIDNSKRLEVDAINKLTDIKFRNDASKFVFHFCNENDSTNSNYYNQSEVCIELRDLTFMYELLYFNDISNKEFEKKLEDMGIEADINNVYL